ncbi:porin [Marinobacter fonticola]|uniref:porin n=1 Tax=Marinobacter fonticola TaxID=2603215 RepID=UPI001D0DAAE5|nr:porin [Marinobacter fonticola]
MNKYFSMLVFGGLSVASFSSLAFEGAEIYGKANVSYENQDDGNNGTWKLQSNASRLGIKGAFYTDIEGLEAIYKAEFEIAIDDGDKDGQTLSQRNIFGGFKHDDLGTLIAGKFDTPLKSSQGKIDQFNDLQGDIKNIIAGENRTSNIIQYSSPRFLDAIGFDIAVVPGEEQSTGAENDGPADTISSAVTFDNGRFFGSVAYDSDVEDSLEADSSGGERLNILRAVGIARLGDFQIGALYQRADESHGPGQEASYLLSGAVKLDRWKFRAQYGLTEGDTTDEELTLAALGVDYKLASKSKAYAYVSRVEAELASSEDTTFGVGFEHKFSM